MNKLFDVPFGSIYEDTDSENNEIIKYVLSCGGGCANKELRSTLEEVAPLTKDHPIIRKWVTREQ